MSKHGGEERRQFVRLDTTLPVSYRVLPSTAMKASTTKNISGGGLCVFLNERLAPGTPLEVAVQLPDRPKPICFTGEVAWCEEYEVVGKIQRSRAIQAGVKFVYFSPKDQEAIMQHVILSLPSPTRGA
ncbi:MAG: PilZ domain-containing protein [Candidatus Omnitrophica bacterium]|nr:PilZ domain-containing protein [Candidatus Omnitrophota bacterium]